MVRILTNFLLQVQEIQNIEQWLPQDWLNRLHASIPPRPRKNIDQFFVVGTRDGRFSIKEIYNHYSGHEEVSIDDM